MIKPIYEVSVFGAGPAGLTLLAALGQTNYFQNLEGKVFSLIDSIKDFPQIKSGSTPNQRVVAVSQSSEKVFRSVGAWDLIDQDRIKAYDQMQIWESHGSGYLTFREQNLGHIIEYDNIVQALLQVVNKQNKTDIYQPNELKEYKVNQGENLKFTLQDNQQFETRLLVGSDGNKSRVKEISKIGTYGWAYNQMGIVCTLQTNKDARIAFQKFLKNGMPLAFLPLRDGMYSIVWTVNQDDYQYLMKLSDSDFVDELNYAMQQNSTMKQEFPQQEKFEIPPLVQNVLNKRLSFPFQTLQSTRYICQRVALIGDAAHSIHPMAGQGMNMGINDSAILANTIIRNLKTGNDIGSNQALDDYESQAKIMNYATSLGMEVIKKLYETNDYAAVCFLRNIGASLIDCTKPLKDILQSQASHHLMAPKKYEWE